MTSETKPIYMVVPCYNEEKRLNLEYWNELIDTAGTKWIFVNDGSTDNTLNLLQGIKNASVISLEKNVGKAEAIRRGVVSTFEALNQDDFSFGYIDADGAFAVESFRFNVAVARMMELVNATRKAIDSGCGAADPAVREATEAIAIMLSLVAPFTAEEMWERLGHAPAVALAGWPEVDPTLLVADSVEAVIQINGKIKERIEVSPTITDAEIEALALAHPTIVAELAGSTPKKVIARAPKLVNIVA